VVLGWDSNDQLYDNVKYTGWHTAYPDAPVRVLPDTCRNVPFEGDMVMFLGEFAEAAESVCPRAVLRRVLKKVADMGYDAVAATEFEFFMFKETPESVREKGFRNLTTMTPGFFGYSVLRSGVRFRVLFDAVAFLPHAVPHLILAIATMFAALFLLRNVVPLYGSLMILVFVYTISRISFATRIINNSLAQIHPELEEAAFVGGLKLLQVMWKILIPLLKPALVYAWIWMALLCYRELTMASVLVTSQANVTLPMIVWGLWLGGSLNQAAAANLVVLICMLPVVLLYFVFGRRSRIAEGA